MRNALAWCERGIPCGAAWFLVRFQHVHSGHDVGAALLLLLVRFLTGAALLLLMGVMLATVPAIRGELNALWIPVVLLDDARRGP